MASITTLEAKELPPDCYVFKHSTRCPVSAAAAAFVRSHEFRLPLFWVNVIEQREIAAWIASTYSVQHESPQLIEIRGGAARRVLGHYDIRADKL